MIPKRGSRLVSVGGHRYRWVLPPRLPASLREQFHRFERGAGRRAGTLTVQDAEGEGPVAQAVLLWRAREGITPEIVSTVVKRMLAAGWAPRGKGPPFVLPEVDVDLLQAEGT